MVINNANCEPTVTPKIIWKSSCPYYQKKGIHNVRVHLFIWSNSRMLEMNQFKGKQTP